MQHLADVSSRLIQSGTEDLARQPDIDTDEEEDVHGPKGCQLIMPPK